MLSRLKRYIAVFAAVIIAALSVMPAFAGIEHMIVHQPTTAEPYVVVADAFAASYQWYVAHLDYGEDFSAETEITPVNGQTSSALDVTPDGKNYVCKITWTDGIQKFSDVVTNSYAITHQPSASEPYVALNNTSGAAFQWHAINFDSVTVADFSGADTLEVTTVYEGTYSDGLWHGTSDVSVDIEFELKENQILSITPCAGFSGTVEEYGEAFLKAQGNAYTYRASEDTDFNLCIQNSENFTAKVEVLTFTDPTPVSGQTNNTLTLNADSKYYFCEITGNGSAKLSTAPFRFDLAITHQPTAREPYVEINSAKSATCKWFETEKVTHKLIYGFTQGDELEIRDLWVGSFKDGKFCSNSSGIFEGQVFLSKGQTLHIALPNSFDGSVGGLQLKDGAYTYTAETNEKFYVYLKNPSQFAFELYITELKNKNETGLNQNRFSLPVDGKTYRCEISVDGNELLSEPFVNSYAVTRQPSTDMPCVETNAQGKAGYQWYRLEKKIFDVVDPADTENAISPYHIYKGSFSNGCWHSQSGQLDFELNLKKNDIVIVEMSDGYKGSVTIGENGLSFSGEAFTFIAPSNGLFNLIVASHSSFTPAFTASVSVMRGVRGSALVDTDSTLNIISNGEYLCAVTFADGTSEESETVIISNAPLDAFEKEIKALTDTATEDDVEKIIHLSTEASKLVPADESDAARIKAVTDSAADTLALITQKSNAVTALAAAVEEYDVNKLVPSDKNNVASLRSEISELLNGRNLSQRQRDTLSDLLDVCDNLIAKIDSLDISVAIRNNPQRTEIKYGQTITLSAVAKGLPVGARIAWYVNNELAAEGEIFSFTPEESSAVTVKILNENGTVILSKDSDEISDTEQIDVKVNFFIKLINFFKKLFGISRTIVQSVK